MPSFGNLWGRWWIRPVFSSFKPDYPTQTPTRENTSHILTQIWHKCLCGCVCFAAANITRARFSGSDEFGYTSFMAYSSLPSLSFFYEFKLQFTLANNSSAMKDNLMMFAGHKGQGEIQFRHPRKRGKQLWDVCSVGFKLSNFLKDFKKYAIAILRVFSCCVAVT